MPNLFQELKNYTAATIIQKNFRGYSTRQTIRNIPKELILEDKKVRANLKSEQGNQEFLGNLQPVIIAEDSIVRHNTESVKASTKVIDNFKEEDRHARTNLQSNRANQEFIHSLSFDELLEDSQARTNTDNLLINESHISNLALKDLREDRIARHNTESEKASTEIIGGFQEEDERVRTTLATDENNHYKNQEFLSNLPPDIIAEDSIAHHNAKSEKASTEIIGNFQEEDERVRTNLDNERLNREYLNNLNPDGTEQANTTSHSQRLIQEFVDGLNPNQHRRNPPTPISHDNQSVIDEIARSFSELRSRQNNSNNNN